MSTPAECATYPVPSYCTNYMTIFLLTHLTPGSRCRRPSPRNPRLHQVPDLHVQVLSRHRWRSDSGYDGSDAKARPQRHLALPRHHCFQQPAVCTQQLLRHTRHSKPPRPVATSYQCRLTLSHFNPFFPSSILLCLPLCVNSSLLEGTGLTDHTSAATLAFL